MARGKGKRLTVAPKVGGAKKSKDLPPDYESTMQINIIKTLKLIRYKDKYVFNYTHHTPNGGNRSMTEGKKLKAMGVKRGYPDLSIDIVTKKYAGLRIELKRGTDGELSDEQEDLLKLLNEEGYYAVEIGYYEAAIDTIKKYIANLI